MAQLVVDTTLVSLLTRAVLPDALWGPLYSKPSWPYNKKQIYIYLFFTRLFPAAGVSLGQHTARQQPLRLAAASQFCPAAGCQAAAPRPPKGLPTGPPRHPGGRRTTRPRATPATSTRARAALLTRRGQSIAAQALAEPPQRTRAPAGAPSPSRGDGGTSACCG